MLADSKRMVVMNVETECGNRILKTLVANGWQKISQYSPSMIDKGIDYDAYTLKRDLEKLLFEWSNCDEWHITGERNTIAWLRTAFLTNE